MRTRRAVLRLGSTVATVALAGGAFVVGGTAHTYADVGAAASPRVTPTPERGVRIVAKPVVYVFPSTPRNGAAQFDVAVRLDQAPDPRSELRTTVTTPKGRLLAVSHRDARPIGSARRHCFVAGEVWDDTGNRRPKPGDLVRVTVDVDRGGVTHAVTRTARAIGATESTPGSEAGFRRLAARRLGCKA
jgi:hypothetical protein